MAAPWLRQRHHVRQVGRVDDQLAPFLVLVARKRTQPGSPRHLPFQCANQNRNAATSVVIVCAASRNASKLRSIKITLPEYRQLISRPCSAFDAPSLASAASFSDSSSRSWTSMERSLALMPPCPFDFHLLFALLKDFRRLYVAQDLRLMRKPERKRNRIHRAQNASEAHIGKESTANTRMK